MHDAFYSYGEVIELKLMSERRCALVTYSLRKAAEEAAKGLYRKIQIKGTHLKLWWCAAAMLCLLETPLSPSARRVGCGRESPEAISRLLAATSRACLNTCAHTVQPQFPLAPSHRAKSQQSKDNDEASRYNANAADGDGSRAQPPPLPGVGSATASRNLYPSMNPNQMGANVRE